MNTSITKKNTKNIIAIENNTKNINPQIKKNTLMKKIIYGSSCASNNNSSFLLASS